MFIPDVINTLLMGLIFMVIVVTVVRPFVLHIVNGAMGTEELQKEAIEAVQQEMMRVSMVAEAQRNNQILFQQLLLDVPEKPKLKPVPEVVIEAEEAKVQEEEVQPDTSEENAVVESTTEVAADVALTEDVAETQGDEAEDSVASSGEIIMQEGESLADVKARMKREQAKAKKPTIPPELLNNANSYEDKVGVVRMVVQNDQSRVASVIRSMIQTQ
ncbi:MAG: Flagellar M-ring protein [Pseudomonadota bacterium]